MKPRTNFSLSARSAALNSDSVWNSCPPGSAPLTELGRAFVALHPLAILAVAPHADGVVVFQRHAEGVDPPVAAPAVLRSAMLVEALADAAGLLVLEGRQGLRHSAVAAAPVDSTAYRAPRPRDGPAACACHQRDR